MLPRGVRVVCDDEGLPPLPETRVVILKGPNASQPLTDVMVNAILANWRSPTELSGTPSHSA
jgi:hypothetical protein